MIKLHLLPRLLIFALMASSCSIEIDQTKDATPAPSIPGTPAASSPALLPGTQVPITWDSLSLAGKLIYISSTTENEVITSNIHMLDLVSGTVMTILHLPRVWIYYATVSPDGKDMVMSYAAPPGSNTSTARILYIMSLDGTVSPRPLFPPPTADDRYTQAEWSPDGRYIYYVHYDNRIRPVGQLDPVYNIFRIRYPDGEPEKIAANAFWPRLSPDSSRLVYVFVDPSSGRNELFVAQADGSDAHQIALSGPASQEIIDAPIFSPDGQSILFSVPSPTQSHQPDWFEKLLGIRVAKAHDVPSDWWSVPVTGGTPTQLTNIQTINLFASISPDQKHVASVSGEGLFVMDLDGSNLTRLIRDPGIHGTVSWLP